jgi:hypothetical protein
VQSVPRFTLIDYHGRQAYQKKTHQRLLLWEVSVVQQRHAVALKSNRSALCKTAQSANFSAKPTPERRAYS